MNMLNHQRKTYDDNDEQGSSDSDSHSSEYFSSYDDDSSESDSYDSSDKDSSHDENENCESTTLSPSYHHQHDKQKSSTMRQRRRGRQPHQRDSPNDIEKHPTSPKRQKVKRRKASSRGRYWLSIYFSWCRLSSYFLLLALLLWILVQIYGMIASSESDQQRLSSVRSHPRLLNAEEFWNQREREEQEGGENNNNRLAGWFGFTNTKQEQTPDKEAIPDGCELQEWQQVGHLNCMELHQWDLSWLLQDAFRQTSNESSIQSGKYLSSGLWRDVFRLPAAGYPSNTDGFVVLKMMKSEHDVDDRNLERHKREAIVMDILTKSPHIVNLFAYCGNSVLTEYLPMDLEDYLRPKRRRKKKHRKKLRHGKPVDEEPPEENPRVTTPEERLDLAFQTAKALEELHQNDIIHADLQSKQFLVDLDAKTSSVTIKLNDFNRCRFLPREKQNVTASTSSLSNLPMNSTLLPPICPILIPTAPGLARSPEEYDMQALTTQMDIYSLANVWYQILTGSYPWVGQANANVVKHRIVTGMKPPLTETDQAKSTTDAVLADLLYAAYELDPNQRATARDLVEGLERLL